MSQHIYTPIIKGKKHDLRAVESLHPKVRALIKPLIELPLTTSAEKTVEERLMKFIQDINEYSGNGRMFVDFYSFIPGDVIQNGEIATIAGYEYLHNIGQRVTPVYGFGRDDNMWEHLKSATKKHDQGFCFRLEEDDLEEDLIETTWEAILTRSSQLDIGINNVDLIIDLRDIRLGSVEEKVELITDFMLLKPSRILLRSVTIAGSSAPQDVSIIEKDNIGQIVRNELKIWANLKLNLIVGSELIYSDYGIVHPKFAVSDLAVGGNINCKIRYTSGSNIIIFRGHKRAGDSRQTHKLAKKVCNHPKYCGRDFSFGDEYIDDVANHIKGPGNPGNWVEADTNHHLTFCIYTNKVFMRKFDSYSDTDRSRKNVR